MLYFIFGFLIGGLLGTLTMIIFSTSKEGEEDE